MTRRNRKLVTDPAAALAVGQRFGGWTVTGEPRLVRCSGKSICYYPCRCDCGTTREVRATALRTSASRSCGCKNTLIQVTHGASDTRLYRIWRAMKARCLRPSYPQYSDYGGRGIGICKEWLVFERFQRWSIAAGYRDHLTIERNDNDGGYCPDNCRWADRFEQMRNTRRVHWLTAFGETRCLKDWLKDPRCSITRPTLLRRLRRGVPPEEAVTVPAGGR